MTAKGETEDKNQLLAVTVAYVNNSAGSAEISADANSNITQTETNKATAEDTSKLNLAGNVLIGNNKADLKLVEKSEIKAGGGVSAVANASANIVLSNEKANVTINNTADLNSSG